MDPWKSILVKFKSKYSNFYYWKCLRKKCCLQNSCHFGSWVMAWQWIGEKPQSDNDGQVPCIYASPDLNKLTHWGRDKMAAIFQTTFSNAFSWMKMFKFWLRFQVCSQGSINNIPAFRVSSHEASQNSLTFPWHFPDHFVVFPDHETYYRHFITALTLILQAIWQITHQK